VTEIDALIAELESGLPTGAGADDGSVSLAITDVTLDLPVESRIVDAAALQISLPRGRLATGFAMPHGRLRLTFVRGDA
jgi:hypothetical protein